MSDHSSDELVLVGEISAPFGVRGQVKMRPLMAKPESLARLPGVVLRFPEAGGGAREETRRVVQARLAKEGQAVLTFEGVADRDRAEALRGALVLIRRSELPPLGADEYYETQLIGLRVQTESGKDLGRITDVHFYPANDVYETELALIPAVEPIVVRVDVAGGVVVVQDIAGLRKDE